jgi:hypothetical protein
MTACATVADVLALAPNPACLSLDRIRLALHIGTDRARVVRQLAIEKHRVDVERMASEFGVSHVEAERLLEAA